MPPAVSHNQRCRQLCSWHASQLAATASNKQSPLRCATTLQQIVLTKADLLTPEEVAQCMAAVREDLQTASHLSPHILAVSGHTGAGVTALWKELRKRSLRERGSLVSQQEVARRARDALTDAARQKELSSRVLH